MRGQITPASTPLKIGYCQLYRTTPHGFGQQTGTGPSIAAAVCIGRDREVGRPASVTASRISGTTSARNTIVVTVSSLLETFFLPQNCDTVSGERSHYMGAEQNEESGGLLTRHTKS